MLDAHFLLPLGKIIKMNTVLRINDEEQATVVEGTGQEAINFVRKAYKRSERRTANYIRIILLGFQDKNGEFIKYQNEEQ